MSPIFNAGAYALASLSSVFVVVFGKLSALTLCGLHAYLQRDENYKAVAAAAAAAAATDPDAQGSNHQQHHHKKKSRKDKDKFEWNEDGSEILRVTIGDSYLDNSKYFKEYDQAVLYSAVALSVLITAELLHSFYGCDDNSGSSDRYIPALVTCFCILKLLHILCKVSWDGTSSRSWELAVSLIVGLVAFLLASTLAVWTPHGVLDFDLDANWATATAWMILQFGFAAVAASISGLFLSPVLKWVRCFWVGTNQLGWDITVVRTGAWTKLMLGMSMALPLPVALLWCKPMAELFVYNSQEHQQQDRRWWNESSNSSLGFIDEATFKDAKFTALLVTAVLLLLLLRRNVQSYLNVGVLAWYESLHGSPSPDTKLLQSKMAVINYFMCRVAVQSLVPAVLIILLAAMSRACSCSAAMVRQASLCLCCWSVLSWGLLSCATLSLFRIGALRAY